MSYNLHIVTHIKAISKRHRKRYFCYNTLNTLLLPRNNLKPTIILYDVIIQTSPQSLRNPGMWHIMEMKACHKDKHLYTLKTALNIETQAEFYLDSLPRPGFTTFLFSASLVFRFSLASSLQNPLYNSYI